MADEGGEAHFPQEEIVLDINSKNQKEGEDKKELSKAQEFASQVEAICAVGKFPDGLTLQGKRLEEPREKDPGFHAVSPTGWRPEVLGSLPNRARDLLYSRDNPRGNEYALLTAADSDGTGHSILSFGFPSDAVVAGRPARAVAIEAKMNGAKAREFLDAVASDPNGGDLARDFLNIILGENAGMHMRGTNSLAVLTADQINRFLGIPAQERALQGRTLQTEGVVKPFTPPTQTK